jgi:hypothetical protein
MAEIVLSEHARIEAARRGIDEDTVREVASRPEQRVTVRPGREVRQSRIVDPASGKLRLLRVFMDTGHDVDTVVTVYRTSKVRKYWRAE